MSAIFLRKVSAVGPSLSARVFENFCSAFCRALSLRTKSPIAGRPCKKSVWSARTSSTYLIIFLRPSGSISRTRGSLGIMSLSSKALTGIGVSSPNKIRCSGNLLYRLLAVSDVASISGSMARNIASEAVFASN